MFATVVRFALFVAGAGLAAGAVCAQETSLPAGTPPAARAPFDAQTARAMQRALLAVAPTDVVQVENVPGAAGTIGLDPNRSLAAGDIDGWGQLDYSTRQYGAMATGRNQAYTRGLTDRDARCVSA